MTGDPFEDQPPKDSDQFDRRQFLGIGTGVGVTLLAGCTTQSDSGAGSDSTTDSEMSTAGSFRLLISDQPVDIGDFDSLNVSFDRARIFGGTDGDDEADDQEGNESETGEETNETETQDETNETEIQDETNETETQNETTETETEEDDEPRDDEEKDEEKDEKDEQETEQEDEKDEQRGGDEDQRGDDTDGEEGGFSIIDLGGATVDLTEVLGDKAIGVFDGELSTGRYSKIELYASNVEGVVDGESVGVKIPSGKLQIVKPFEITADEPVSFVFDINVVKKGQTGEYNLLPVISESGVAGKDVDVEEIDNRRGKGRDEKDEDDETDDEDEPNSTADQDEPNSTVDDGNQTATGNETAADGQ